MTDLNKETYSQADVVSVYAARDGLTAVEWRILSTYPSLRVDVDLLDLGVGTGRTSDVLSTLTRNYVGVDYSEAMLRQARSAHPSLSFVHADARTLPFQDESFDVVVFSFNGLDYLHHDARLQVLNEVMRVLRPSGLFYFSSHNLNYRRAGLLPWQGRPQWSKETLSRSVHALKHRRRRKSLFELQYGSPGYAMLNDPAHDYSLLTYYVDWRQQVEQLKKTGFADAQVFSQEGDYLGPYPDDQESVWLHYTCWKSS